jgi:thiol-disulfide isomerase/thioredoxin
MRKTILALLIAIFIPFNMVHAQTEQPVVRAVLFYSPTCGHCEFVINQTILPMMDEYGDQLQVIGIDVTQQDGQALFLSATQMFNLEQAGVPFLVIDDMYLIGSGDIPEQFPSLVKTYLAQGGVDYPNIPGLQQALGQASGAESSTSTPLPQSINTESQAGSLQTPPVPATVSSTSPSPTATPGIQFVNAEDSNWTDRFAHDPVGNTLAVIVLFGMLG